MAYDMLLSPMKIGTMTVRNRTVMTAAEMSLGRTDGCPTEKLMDYYEERAKGGVGLIIPGICRVNDMGAASTFTQLSMSRDENIEPMRVFAERIHAYGAKLCLQLHHPGRQGYASSINTLPVIIPIVKRFPRVLDALFRCTPLLLGLEEKKICMSVQSPSNCELSAHGATRIHAMSRREIKHLIRDFVDAAERCKKAGVDAVELHGGHGYLIQQFLSPNTNLRTDEYGGDFEGRLRFLREIIEGIRERCGRDYPLIVRLTVDEMYAAVGKSGKGYDLETGKKIAGLMNEERTGFIDSAQELYRTASPKDLLSRTNTTIGAIVTNGKFDKAELTRIAAQARNAYARSINPVGTLADGDTIYASSCGELVDADVNMAGTLAAEVMAKAIENAVVSSRMDDAEYLSNCLSLPEKQK